MVGDHVHHNLEPFAVCLLHVFAVQAVAAEAGIDVVVVGAGVAVVGAPGGVVLQQRGAPDGRGAQVTDVVQVIDDSAKVSAVAGAGVLPVGFFHRGVRTVNGRVAVRETVRDNEVQKVGR